MTRVNISARLSEEQRQWLFARDNMIYWQSGNVIIPCLGKTANTAIKAAILEAEGGVDPFYNVHADPRLLYVDRDFALRARHVPIVAVIRDPYDRLVSFWRDKVANRTPETFTASYLYGVMPGMSFLAFVNAFFKLLCNVPSVDALGKLGDLRPAADLFTYQQRFLPMKVFKFDTLLKPDGWNEFKSFTARSWDLPASLPKLNGPRVPEPILTVSDEHLIRKGVRKFYEPDYMILENMAR